MAALPASSNAVLLWGSCTGCRTPETYNRSSKAAWYGNLLLKMLSAKSVLTVQGDTLQIASGRVGWMTDYGTYSASVLSNLELVGGKNAFFPAGKVQIQVVDVTIIIADFISDADGSYLIDVLCDAYSFSTAEPQCLPTVTS